MRHLRVPPSDRDASLLLAAAGELARREGGHAVAVTIRADGARHASVVNAALIDHPTSGDRVVGFVAQGRQQLKLVHLRARPVATVVFRSGRDWVAVEGQVELVGPDAQDLMSWPESAAVFHSIYVAAIGGSPADWATADPAIQREGHAAVLVRADRVYGAVASP